MIDKEKIDKQFIEILQKKLFILKKESIDHENIISRGTLLKVGLFIDNLKPISKYRSYKYQIIEFTEELRNNPNLDDKQVVELVQLKLSDIFLFLKSKYSFVGPHDWLWSGVFNLVLDLFLIFMGIGKYYYYIPVFTIIAIVRNVLKLKKAKEEGRYIDF